MVGAPSTGLDAVTMKTKPLLLRGSNLGIPVVVTDLSRFSNTQPVGIMNAAETWGTGCHRMVSLCFPIGCHLTVLLLLFWTASVV
jgi:hypothetical protein